MTPLSVSHMAHSAVHTLEQTARDEPCALSARTSAGTTPGVVQTAPHATLKRVMDASAPLAFTRTSGVDQF